MLGCKYRRSDVIFQHWWASVSWSGYTVTTGISSTHYWWAFRLLWVCFSDILETLNYSMLSTFWTTQKPEWENWYIMNWTSMHEFGWTPGAGDRQGVLRFMGSQRVGRDWATELNGTSMQRCIMELHRQQPQHPSSSPSQPLLHLLQR